MKRRLLRIAILAFGGLVGLAAAILLVARHMGSGTIQEWIGSQFQDIANAYLNPRLTFTDLSYEYPLTVSLRNLHLTADDPANPGHTIDIIACDRAEISLADIPQIGKPVVIEKISLTEPLISAVAVEPRSKKFVGFANLIRAGSINSSPDSTASAPTKLSDIFRMRQVQIIDGKIVYNPRIPGTDPMALDKINTLLNFEPTEQGWYKVDTDIARKPVFDFQVKGDMNLDTFMVRDVDVNILADLSQDKLDYLPPEIQALLKQYDAKGTLTIALHGDMPVMDPMSGNVRAKVTLDRANLSLNKLRIPVDNLSLEARFEQRKVYMPLLRIAALGGTADVAGSVDLNDRLDSQLRVNISSMVPGRLVDSPALAAAAQDRLDLDLNLGASLLSLIGKAPPPRTGPLASISLRDFRFSANDPVNPKQRLDLVACRKLDVDLTQPIISGKPLCIDGITLDSPIISAVSVSPGAMQFVGIPSPAPETEPAAQTAAAPSTQPAAATPKIAEIARVNTFQLTNAKVIYDPRLPGTTRMCIDQINASLNIDPNDPGSYKLSTDIDHFPIYKIGVNGEINIDNPGLQNLIIDLEADLSQGDLSYLPPQLQLVLKHFNAQEKLNVHAAASVAMSDLDRASGQLDVTIQDIDLTQGGLNVPVERFGLSAHVQDRKLSQTIKIHTLNNEFDINGTTTLNSRLDTDVTMGLNNVTIEPLLTAMRPGHPAPDTSTTLNAQIELQSPLMVALGGIPGNADESAATLAVRNLRLTTVNPIDSTPLDFFACDSITASLSNLPGPGKPVGVRDVEINHPTIRAIAVAPQSSRFAGISDLQDIAASQTSPAAGSANMPTTMPSGTAVAKGKICDLFRMRSLAVSNASIYYDPRIDTTVPMSFDQITAKIDLDAANPSAYFFDVLVPSKPDLNLELAGRADLDALKINPLKLDLTTRVGQDSADYKYLPPQVQVLMRPYDPVAANIQVNVTGTVPMTKPLDSDITVDVAVDRLAVTAGGYRLPIDQVRMPIRYTPGQVEFLDSSPMGGPSLTAFDGFGEITGTVMLDDKLDSTLSVKVDGMLVQSVLADKIAEPRMTNLIGDLKLDLELIDAPVLQIIAEATPSATTAPSAPATEPEVQSAAYITGAPKYMSDLPASWGSANIELTHARLAGLEVIQGISNIARSAFADIINAKDKDAKRTVTPKEHALVVCDFVKDHIRLDQIHYEGEALAADGKGYITLEQQLDLYLTGGVFQKFGGFMKQISDSLLYYHVYGTLQHIQYDVHRGDGKPIVEGVKKVAGQTETGVKVGFHEMGVGLNAAGNFMNGLFHKKQNQNQNQPQAQDQGQNQPQTQPSPSN
jgi:hypothetical protein